MEITRKRLSQIILLLSFQQIFAQQLFVLPNNQYNHIAADEFDNVYLLSSRRAILSKFFVVSNYDSVLTVGGKNLSFQESFVEPTELVIPDAKTIYVVDKLSNQIKLLNFNLKFLKTFDASQIKEDKPFQINSAAITPSGELFLQNSVSSIILRINTFGETDRMIGGNNYAEASITENAILAATKEHLYVFQPQENTISLFDHNANFQKSFVINFPIQNLSSDYHGVIGYNQREIFLLKDEKFQKIADFPDDVIVDCCFVGKKIFVLTADSVHLVRFSGR